MFLSVVSLGIWTIFFFKLYNVTPDLITWTNLAFGSSVAIGLFSLVLSVFASGLAALGGLVVLVAAAIGWLIGTGIVTVLWVTFVMHLRKAKAENTMDFS